MVFWHTAWKKHHSWAIRKTRSWNFLILFTGFYGLYWFNRYSTSRTLAWLDYMKPTEEQAKLDRKMYGYRKYTEPGLAASKKNYLIATGDYQPRLPTSKQLLPYDALVLSHPESS